jgi:hypothetical protein
MARAFLMLILLTVLPPDFLISGSDNKHDFGGHFCHFESFFLFNSFEDTICPSDCQCVVLICTANQQFYSCRLFAALRSAAMKICASIMA